MEQFTIIKRVKAPTPAFFKKLRIVGLAIAAAGTTLLYVRAVLPDVFTRIGGYLVAVGLVIASVSQTTVDEMAV